MVQTHHGAIAEKSMSGGVEQTVLFKTIMMRLNHGPMNVEKYCGVNLLSYLLSVVVSEGEMLHRQSKGYINIHVSPHRVATRFRASDNAQKKSSVRFCSSCRCNRQARLFRRSFLCCSRPGMKHNYSVFSFFSLMMLMLMEERNCGTGYLCITVSTCAVNTRCELAGIT